MGNVKFLDICRPITHKHIITNSNNMVGSDTCCVCECDENTKRKVRYINLGDGAVLSITSPFKS